jgi:hypothetical protein
MYATYTYRYSPEVFWYFQYSHTVCVGTDTEQQNVDISICNERQDKAVLCLPVLVPVYTCRDIARLVPYASGVVGRGGG